MDFSKSRAGQLREIERAIRMARHGSYLGPAGPNALVACLVVFGLGHMLRSFGLAMPWWVPMVAGFVASGVVIASAKYRSYSALIYDLLVKYEPRNIMAYKALQDDVAKNGLSRAAMEAWLEAEWDAVSAPQKMSDAQERFVSKKVGPHLAGKDQ